MFLKQCFPELHEMKKYISYVFIVYVYIEDILFKKAKPHSLNRLEKYLSSQMF